MSNAPSEISAVLEPGETLLWHARPRAAVFVLRGLPCIAYSITWAILGAFWFHGAQLAQFQGWWVLVPWFSVPYIAAGLSFWLYPIRLARKASDTWYAITNRRIFIAETRRNAPPKLRVFTPDEIAPPEIKKRFDGLYDVIFTHRAQKNPHLTPGLDQGFFGLPDGEPAAAAINETTNP